MTWKIDGRVRIKQDASFPFDCVSVPGLFTRAVRKYSDHLALVSRPDADGKRKTYTYKFVHFLFFIFHLSYLVI